MRQIGVSNVGMAQIEIVSRETDIVSVQNAFNIKHGLSRDALDYCENREIVFIPWMPLGDGSISWDDPDLCQIALKHNATPAQIALAGLTHLSYFLFPGQAQSGICVRI